MVISDNVYIAQAKKTTGSGENMGWFNVYGLIAVVVILIPNIVFVLKSKEEFQNKYRCKLAEVTEQIGRFGCFIFMIFNIPNTYFGLPYENAFTVYVAVNCALIAAYLIIWVICFKKSGVFRSLALSIIPSAMFLFSGIMIRSILLTIAATLFAPSHILISYKNAK